MLLAINEGALCVWAACLVSDFLIYKLSVTVDTWKEGPIPLHIIVQSTRHICDRLINLFDGNQVLDEDTPIALEQIQNVLKRGVLGDFLDLIAVLGSIDRHGSSN